MNTLNKMQKDTNEKIELAPRRSIRSTIIFILFGVIGLAIVFSLVAFNKADAPTNISTSECYINPDLQTKWVGEGNNYVEAEIVTTPKDMQKGLSDRDCLASDKAMLFSYNEASLNYCFWMKDMNFPIDMIWLSSDGIVVTIKESVSPDTYPNQSFCPDTPAQHVLEVSSGRAKEFGWSVGTQLSL